MALRLLDEDTEFSLEIPTDSTLSEAICLQMARLTEVAQKDDFRTRFSQILAHALGNALDPDLQGPSEAQLRYGLAISKELGISLPADALRYRGAMHEFISRHVELFKARTRPRPDPESAAEE